MISESSSMRSRLYCFFSSRRRHTRYWRDWSSDVCSSDLDSNLAQARGPDLGDAKLGDVALELVEALEAPRAHKPGEAAPRDAVALLDGGPHLLRIEQAEGALEDRAELPSRLEHVDRLDLHE